MRKLVRDVRIPLRLLFLRTLLCASAAARAQEPELPALCAPLVTSVPVGATGSALRRTRQGLQQAQRHIDQATRAYQSERYADAIRFLRLAYALKPQPDILFNLAQSCRALGEHDAALKLFERVVKESASTAVHDAAQRDASELREALVSRSDEQGRKLLEEKQYAAAITIWEGAYAISAKPMLLFRIAQAQRLRGDPDAALAFYERFLRADPKSDLKSEASEHIAHLRAQLLDAEAQKLVKEQRFGQAIASWDAAYKLHPAAVYLYQRAEAEKLAGLSREALSTYARFLAAEPDSPLRAEVQRSCEKLRAQLLEADAKHFFPLQQLAISQERLQKTVAPRQPKPLYRRWWLWTSIAATLTVGGVLAAVLATQVTIEPSYPNVRVVQLQGAVRVF